MEIAVCSWSYRLSAERVAEEMTKCDVKNVHLALNPFVDPLAIVPGTAGETENVAGTGGVDSLEKQRADIEEYLASGRWKVSSTLHNSRYDDYSTLESIRRTGGLVPDEHWEENRKIIADVAKLTAEWKSPYMMLYGKGNPVKAVKTLAPWIRHIHIKDAKYAKTPGTWGEEVEWTKGEVNADAFIAALRDVGYGGCLAVEREAGDDRPGDIARAVMDLRRRGISAVCAPHGETEGHE